MSAPSSDGGGFEKDSEVPMASTSLDFLSTDFNPLTALYASDISLPFPDVPAFNNLAEYENVMVKEGAEVVPDPKTRRTLTENKKTSKREQMKEHNAERREKILAITTKPQTEKEKEREESEAQLAKTRRQRFHRNLLTRIEDCNTGPLSVLKKCVMNQHFVKVVTRSAVSVRGYCTGYILAFDKHVNLAMIDVDEYFIKPCLVKEKRKRRKNKRLTAEESADANNNKDNNAKQRIKAEKSKHLQMSSETDQNSNRNALKDGKSPSESGKIDSNNAVVESPLFATGTESFFSTGSDIDSDSDVLAIDIPDDSKTGISQSKSDILRYSSTQLEKNKEVQDSHATFKKPDVSSFKDYTSAHTSLSKKIIDEDVSVTKLSKDLTRSVHLSEPIDRVRKNFTPSSANVIRRHVNQLFVRGDNVVYISIIQ